MDSPLFSPLSSEMSSSIGLSRSQGSTLTPLTISAHDIEGGSMDFTELANPNFSLDSTAAINYHKNEGGSGNRMEGKENLFTPPKSTSSPYEPVRVRVSAKKLREIQSPYVSISSSSSLSPLYNSMGAPQSFSDAGKSTSGSQGHVTNLNPANIKFEKSEKCVSDLIQGKPSITTPHGTMTPEVNHEKSSTPHALTPPGTEGKREHTLSTDDHMTRNVGPPVDRMTRNVGQPVDHVTRNVGQPVDHMTRNVGPPNSMKAGLSQGVLQMASRADTSPLHDVSTESLLVQTGPLQSSWSKQGTQIYKENLLQKKSKSANMVKSHAKSVPHPTHRIIPSGPVSHSQGSSTQEGVLETAQLVAMCTAAATTAVLATKNPHNSRQKDDHTNGHVTGTESAISSSTPTRISHSGAISQDNVIKKGTAKQTNHLCMCDVTAHEPTTDIQNTSKIDKIIPACEQNSTSQTLRGIDGKDTTTIGSQTVSTNQYVMEQSRTVRPTVKRGRSYPNKKKGACMHVDTNPKWHQMDTTLSTGLVETTLGGLQPEVLPNSGSTLYSDIMTRIGRIEDIQHAQTLGLMQSNQGTTRTQSPDGIHLPSEQRDALPQTLSGHLFHPDLGSSHPAIRQAPGSPLSGGRSSNNIGTGGTSNTTTGEPSNSGTGGPKPERLEKTTSHEITGSNYPPVSHPVPSSKSPEEDGLQNVAKVLCDVQLARSNIELACALTETEEQYTDMGKLLQSLDPMSNENEFTDVAWKVSRLMEKAQEKKSLTVSNDEMPPPSKVEVKAPTGKRKKPASGLKAWDKKTEKRNLKVSSEEAKQKSALANKMRTTAIRGTTQPSVPNKSLPLKGQKFTPVHYTDHTHQLIQHPQHAVCQHHTSNNKQQSPSDLPPTTHPAPLGYLQWTAVPIGPALLRPSPVYTLESQSALKNVSTTDKQTSTMSPPIIESPVQPLKVSTADACLQTSFESASPTDQSVSLISVLSDRAEDSLVRNGSQSNCSVAVSEGVQTEVVVTIEGHHHSPTPSPPPPPTSHNTHTTSEVGVLLTSDELNERLQKQLECRATEWVHQELMVRMLSQIEPTCDPVSSSQPFEPPNSCSTCPSTPDPCDVALAPLLGPDGVQLFVDAGQPVNSQTVVQAVKEAIKNELVDLVRQMGKSPSREPDDENSYTPPESYTISSTSLSETAPLSTPHSTPPSSHTPSPDHTLTCDEIQVCAPLCTPSPTPPQSLHTDESTELVVCEQELVGTPQASTDDEAPSTHKSVTTSEYTQRDISTPMITPPPVPISIESPSQSESDHVIITPHTKDLTLSESSTVSTTSCSQSLTPSTTSTDRGISLGEHVRKRPPLPLPNSSLSEGEVPLSPGDVRWNSLFARTVDTGQPASFEAFLDLKNSPSDSVSDSQDSHPSESKVLSVGEICRPPTLVDPFERFLHKLTTSTPETDSSVDHSPSDNTLSELPSMNVDDSKLLAPEITPSVTKSRKHQKKKKNIIVKPYAHDKNKSVYGGRGSPGEITHRHNRGLVGSKRDSSLSFPHSEGEVPARIRLLKQSSKPNTTAIEEIVTTLNETRDGIDVINVSRFSLNSSNIQKLASPVRDIDKLDSTVSDISCISTMGNPSGGMLPPVIKVRPAQTKASEQQSDGSLFHTQHTQSMTSTGGLLTDIHLSELDLTDTTSEQSLPPSQPPPPISPYRTSITLTIPTVSNDMTVDDDDSYSSDLDFSSVSIPGID